MNPATEAARIALPPVTWRSLPGDPDFRRGMIDVIPTALGVSAWGLVTGVAMVKAGLSTTASVLMTLLVYAGSAQLAVLPLLMAGSPLWVIWLTATCVNLRFVIFSALWRNYFGHLPRGRRCRIGFFSGDIVFVIFLKRYPVPTPGPGQEAYFWGCCTFNWLAWQIPCIAGVVLADVVPVHWGLGFAGVLALLGVACSMLAGRIELLSALVAAGGAIAAFALPLRMNILVAIAAAVVVGLAAEAAFPPRSRIVAQGRVPADAEPPGGSE